jgi:hypothetical protein
VLKKMLKYVQKRGLHIHRLYADKGFCTIPVLRYLLECTALEVIMATPIKDFRRIIIIGEHDVRAATRMGISRRDDPARAASRADACERARDARLGGLTFARAGRLSDPGSRAR